LLLENWSFAAVNHRGNFPGVKHPLGCRIEESDRNRSISYTVHGILLFAVFAGTRTISISVEGELSGTWMKGCSGFCPEGATALSPGF
jgi:hypothetical protein